MKFNLTATLCVEAIVMLSFKDKKQDTGRLCNLPEVTELLIVTN